MGTNLIRPSWKQGFARSLGESAAPEQYPPFFWCPALGNTGLVHEVRNQFAPFPLIGTSYWARDGVRHLDTGDGDQLTIPHDPRQTPTTSFYTFEYLFRVDVSLANYGRVFTQGGYNGQVNIYYRTSGGGRWYFNVVMTGDSSEGKFAANPYVVGKVHHLVVTVDGAINTEARCYFDGVLGGGANSVDTAVSGTIDFDTDDWIIGGRYNGTSLGVAIWPGVCMTARQVWERSQDFYAPLRLRRRPIVGIVGAPPVGLDIPIAMHHYKQLQGAN